MRIQFATAVAIFGLCQAAPAVAGPCEDSFDREAKILGSMRFTSQIELPGLTQESAFRQFRMILPEHNIRIRTEDAGTGQINAVTDESLSGEGKPVDIYYSNAAGRGLVQMTFTRKTNLLRKSGPIRDQMCSILNRLVVEEPKNSGKGGKTIARAINADSIQLSQQVRAATTNPARLRSLFEDHRYAVTGRVLAITEPKKRKYVVTFEGDGMSVNCRVGGKQDRTVALLQIGRRETLVGDFKNYDTGEKSGSPAIWLEDCKAP